MKHILIPSLILCFFGCTQESASKATPPKAKVETTKKAITKPVEKTVTPKAAPEKKPAPSNDAVKDDGKVVTVDLKGTDQMKYSLSEINVPAGRTVKLTLSHSGKLKANMMGHNFVLLKAGTDVAKFAQKAAVAKATGYLPPSEKGSVIANTKVIGGGESTSIEFSAPAPGTYDYICTFPGHYFIMKGKLIVK